MKFGLVGLVNTIVSYSIYSVLVYSGFHYLIGSVAGFIISVFTSFFLNSKFVFKETACKEKLIWWKVVIKSYISYGLTGLIINNLLLILLISSIDISQYLSFEADVLAKAGIILTNIELAKYLAPILIMGITIPLNFTMNKYWAYRQNKAGDT
jgi:putative flippase GtrA